MSSRAVNTSSNRMQRIKEELLRILSIISYSDKYETNEEEYKTSSQKDDEIIRTLEEADRKMNDYEGFVSGGRRPKHSELKPPRKGSSILSKPNARELSDDERTL